MIDGIALIALFLFTHFVLCLAGAAITLLSNR